MMTPVETDLPRGIVTVTATDSDAWLLETNPAESQGKSKRYRALRVPRP